MVRDGKADVYCGREVEFVWGVRHYLQLEMVGWYNPVATLPDHLT